MSPRPLSACRSVCGALTLELKASLPCSLLPVCPPASDVHGWPCLTLAWPQGPGGGMGWVCTVQLLFRGSGRELGPASQRAKCLSACSIISASVGGRGWLGGKAQSRCGSCPRRPFAGLSFQAVTDPFAPSSSISRPATWTGKIGCGWYGYGQRPGGPNMSPRAAVSMSYLGTGGLQIRLDSEDRKSVRGWGPLRGWGPVRG